MTNAFEPITAADLRKQAEAIVRIQGGHGVAYTAMMRAVVSLEALEANQPLTFTTEEWRLIAAACVKVKPTSLINGAESVKALHAIANRIADETGKVQ